MKYFKAAVAFIFLALMQVSVYADALRLNGGSIVTGKILDQTEKVIVISTRDGVFTFPLADVLEVEKDGQGRIAKLQKERLAPLKGALFSLIPFYSGIYASESQAFGVPFAMANGVLAVNFLSNQFRTELSYADGVGGFFAEMDHDLNLFRAFLSTFSNPAANITGNGGMDSYYSLQFQWKNLYNLPQYRVVRPLGGRMTTERHSNRVRDESLRNFMYFSIVHAAATYMILQSQSAEQIGQSRGRSSDDSLMQAYASPLPGGFAFGFITSF